jgi:hypothetical protein
MVSNVTSTTFSQTYRDDFADSDNYHRILFNGGRALQARELTQLQTIIQREHERHARFVFKEGAAVHSGGYQLNPKFEYAKLNTTTYSLPTNYNSLIGQTFTGLTSTIKVRIVDIRPVEGTHPATIFIEYIDNNSVSGGTSPVRLTPGEVINGDTSGVNLQVQTTNTTANPALGRGLSFSVKESVYFVNGHFVFTPSQSIIVAKYITNPTEKIGFTVNEEVVTASDNTALYDNSNNTPNLTAPGADRYRIRLTLELERNVDSDTTFIPAFDIIDGRVAAAKLPGDESLNVIRDIMAKRTHEESGDYTVKPFILKTLPNDSDNTKLDITINDGIAYVKGYRYETFSPIRIPIDKPRTTTTINNNVIAAEYGNYILCSNFVGMPTFGTFATVNLRSAITHGGSTIGSARVRAVEKFGSTYRLYIFDVSMNAGQQFSSVRSIGTSTAQYSDLILENGVAVIKDGGNNNLFFDLSNIRPASLTDISLTTQRLFTGTTTGSGTIQFNLSAPGETFANSSNWLMTVDSSGAEQSIGITAGGNGTASVTLGSLPTSSAVSLAAYVNKGSATVKTKTLTNRTATLLPDSDNTISLERTDIYRINSIKNGSVSGNDITNYYIFDFGQRDNFYDEGKLYLKRGYPAPAGNVYVDFDYFEHGASGDFFAVNSYIGQIDYEDIPNHRQKNGERVYLRNVLDFRSRKANTTNDFTGTGAIRIELPANTDLITADVSYYLGQAFRIVINQDGNFVAVPGNRSLYPVYPEIPVNSMEVYKLSVNPYCLSDSDVSLTYIDNKRYTMRNIAGLEDRLNRMEEFATLNLLELETSALEVLDSSGNNRLKIGITADGFKDHFQSARNDTEYKASTDIYNKELRPPFIARSTELIYDSANSQYVSLIGDTVYPLYEEVVYTSNNSASGGGGGVGSSGTTPVNEYNLGVIVGNIKLSPASDNWYDIQRLPAKIIDGGYVLDPANASVWNDWGFNWSGVSESELKDNYTATKEKTTEGTSSKTNYVATSTITSDEVVTTSMGDELLKETSIQYQRGRFIFFKAQGLRPNTRYFGFYDGVNISSWIQSGPGKFQYFASLSSGSPYLDPGNRYDNASSFPIGGPTAQIFSDASGVLEGIFFVPPGRFLTGTRQFVLIDISKLDKNEATSYVETSFISAGTLKTYQESIKHTRKYVVSTAVITTVIPNPEPVLPPAVDPAPGEPVVIEPVAPATPAPVDPGTVAPVESSNESSDDTGPANWYSADGKWVGSGYAHGEKTIEYEKTYTKEFKEADQAGKIDKGTGGPGGDAETVICTALHSLGLLPDDIYKLDAKFGQKVNSEDRILGDGYRLWATPVANYIKGDTIGSKIALAFVAPIARAWAQEMAHIMEPENYKANVVGKVIMTIGHPICRIIGKTFLDKDVLSNDYK